ncbi:hypothetical protein COV53_00440 [Candidatus Gottesmanbacteria bacterium CG11_big_fil_rev_8_21_14_0_20_37_11]|uniref:S1 motif domain-containing protein n=3 Tax=Candidatus Gottesmaniibacteriota TaxID=1752720 RepID=A0A2M7RQD7_9BACT|nr:MAG: hypothetical protein AUJ73_04590 [Candidatus Gottesmanbacteria bacterium CG1_02_37_22]PIP32423.1 MAG: hypothetical protein COX23_04805 [Candidatus Gottesmanbacteria bacterium CG23_combo_of_CG06-09_8_20_14_all_37_19]PIR08925.1 MAG: hypothetical protein COV53_00440 [Candidatus Gottesmanbacteria bacterium CG11_big_fil_rev_8_21_14_0_20_37_11]PIZ02249.1 MAG: hypothetical protein COY59_05805 [Candidatus Gottesmanbacteria bacterium CG_4_10_14_0_8_um_filter_37_24]
MIKKVKNKKLIPDKVEKSKVKSEIKIADDLAVDKKAAKTESNLQTSSPKKKSIKEPQTMAELLSMVGDVKIGAKRGDTVEGKVVSVSSREILVDIGKKSFGIVAEWELEQVKEYASSLKPGINIVAQVMNPENDMGYVVLSLRRANFERRWLELDKAKEEGLDLNVSILEVAKGGLLVDWQGLRGFVPYTQLESSFASNPLSLLGKRIDVKVLEVDKSLNRLVVSQKASSLGVTPSVQKEKLDKIKPNDVLKGIVSGVASFGVFVDMDGLEGLVHISEIAWEKVENPASIFKVGDKVDVMVLDVNKEEGKLNLSVKRLTPDPWKNILDRYPIDSTLSGEVVRQAPYGYFIRLEPGIEGLLHISKVTTGDEPKVGENINCMIENIDTVKRKISLTLVPKEKPVGYR